MAMPADHRVKPVGNEHARFWPAVQGLMKEAIGFQGNHICWNGWCLFGAAHPCHWGSVSCSSALEHVCLWSVVVAHQRFGAAVRADARCASCAGGAAHGPPPRQAAALPHLPALRAPCMCACAGRARWDGSMRRIAGN